MSGLHQIGIVDPWRTSLLAFVESEKELVRREDAAVVRSHRLTDWSGEAEVENEIEEIAKKIEALFTTSNNN